MELPMNFRYDGKQGTVTEIRLRIPFEAHAHFRDGPMMYAVAKETARHFPRGAVAMPNLVPPIVTPQMAREYKSRIRMAIGDENYPLVMTGYLTKDMDPALIAEGFKNGDWQAMKFYPHNPHRHQPMTTNAHDGISDIREIARVFEVMQEIGMPALFHGERASTKDDKEADVYDRERIFFEEDAPWLLANFPELKISFEHGSTRIFVKFMETYGKAKLIVGTLTAHHLLLDRNDFLINGPDVHMHCWPVLKRREDLEALRKLATAGHRFIFAGTDSAPHPTDAKEKACGCAGGVVTAHAAVELYTEVFEDEGRLHNLEAFLSTNAAEFYGLPATEETIRLVREDWTVDSMIETAASGTKIRPLFYHEKAEARRKIRWKLAA